jgi:hypothetical protein
MTRYFGNHGSKVGQGFIIAGTAVFFLSLSVLSRRLNVLSSRNRNLLVQCSVLRECAILYFWEEIYSDIALSIISAHPEQRGTCYAFQREYWYFFLTIVPVPAPPIIRSTSTVRCYRRYPN